jgi:Uroporphyrinogen-III synthase
MEPGSAASSGGAPLRGRGIVVTRPAAQATRLVQLLEAAGARVILFPVIEIRTVADAAAARARLDRLASYDVLVFVSANAVEHGFVLRTHGASWPAGLSVVAVGAGTALALRAHGVSRVLLPRERYDSEGMLALPELTDVAGKKVLIVRGVGGREFLGQTLAARGAQVDYAECYERARPAATGEPLIAAWEHRAVHAVTMTSSEGLHNLWTMLGERGQTYLRATPLFVTHERIAAAARALGLDDVIAAPTSDQGLLETLVHYYA